MTKCPPIDLCPECASTDRGVRLKGTRCFTRPHPWHTQGQTPEPRLLNCIAEANQLLYQVWNQTKAVLAKGYVDDLVTANEYLLEALRLIRERPTGREDKDERKERAESSDTLPRKEE